MKSYLNVIFGFGVRPSLETGRTAVFASRTGHARPDLGGVLQANSAAKKRMVVLWFPSIRLRVDIERIVVK